MFVDTHTHLYLEQFDKDREIVIKRAIDNNVKKMFLPNVDSSTIERLKETTSLYKNNCFPLMGLHPSSVDENYQTELEIIETELKSGKYYGVGEIGIDLYWEKNKNFLNEQKDTFIRQIRIAKELKLPVVIHVRKAFNDIFNILDKENDYNLTGIFHCFSGNNNEAEKIISYGDFKLGIGGVLTYKNSKLPEILKNIALKYIVLETDSPFLPPVPHRGERNESSYIVYVADVLAKVYNISLNEIEKITTENAAEIFHF